MRNYGVFDTHFFGADTYEGITVEYLLKCHSEAGVRVILCGGHRRPKECRQYVCINL